jgi:putative modified peptide
MAYQYASQSAAQSAALLGPQLESLMARLSTDDAFRAALMADPSQTLSALGIALDPCQVPALRTLPSKQTMGAERMAVQQKLDNASGAIAFFLTGP